MNEAHGGMEDSLPFTAPVEMTLPPSSTWISGPVQETSKYVLMVMLAADGVKNRLFNGARRVMEEVERKEVSREEEGRRWGMAGYLRA